MESGKENVKTMKKNTIFLLVIIYLAFIALGLPDAILGSAWNLIRLDLNQSLGTMGFMTVIIYVMSVLATYNAPRLLRILETKKITFISILLTGVSLMMISRVHEFYQMLFFAIPLGLGAGAIDVSLNHYLASHYKAHHMNFLHTFYGIGVTFGPTVMALTLKANDWRMGYMIVGAILLGIAVLVVISFPLWNKENQETLNQDHLHIPLKTIFKTKGVIPSIFIFLFYVHVETLGGIWIASYFYIERDISFSTAALFTSTFYLALTIGRLVSGFVSYRLAPNTLIRMGESLMIVSAFLMLFHYSQLPFYFVIVFLLGFGCAPIFPNMMFMNSKNFDKSSLSRVMSLQMAVGYIGVGVLTPLAGLFFEKISISIFPYLVLSVSILIFIITLYFIERIHRHQSETQINQEM